MFVLSTDTIKYLLVLRIFIYKPPLGFLIYFSETESEEKFYS